MHRNYRRRRAREEEKYSFSLPSRGRRKEVTTFYPKRRKSIPFDAVYYPYADCISYFRITPPYLTCIRFRFSFWRTGEHRCPLLQPGYLRQLGPSARRSVCMDPFDEDVRIRTSHTRRAVAPRPRKRPVLLHRFHTTRYRLARYLHQYDGEFAVIWNGLAHTPILPLCAQQEFLFSLVRLSS